MKRIVILMGVIGTLAFSSCKRDWVCSCTDQNGNVTNHDINNQQLIDARSKCRAMGYSTTVAGVTTSEDCTIQ